MITAKESDVEHRRQEMMDSLPPYYQESPEANAIMHGNAWEIERKRAEAQDLLNQFFVSTATWGLDYWDRVLDLEPQPRMTIEKRRSRIIAKLGGAATATKEYLEGVINAYTRDGSAKIYEFNKEYRFEAEVTASQLLDAGVIYREIDQLKPAHLEFLLRAAIRSTIILKVRNYEFPVKYRVTNQFSTAQVKGGLAKVQLSLESRAYTFAVRYPVTNQFAVSSSRADITGADIGVDAYANSNKVVYQRVGVTIPGAESASRPTGKTEYDVIIGATANDEEVTYPRVGDTPGKRGYE